MSSPVVTLESIIGFVESGNDPHALRTESGVLLPLISAKVNLNPAQTRILAAIATANKCSVNTAKMIYSTSWGRFQDMGFNIYNNYNPQQSFSIVDFINSAAMQSDHFQLFVKSHGINYAPADLCDPTVRAHFGQYYNGDAAAYSASIANALKHYGLVPRF